MLVDNPLCPKTLYAIYLVTIEDIAINLVKAMGKELGINFLQDGILMKGLLNHLGPMLERVRIGHQLDSNVDFFIPKEKKRT